MVATLLLLWGCPNHTTIPFVLETVATAPAAALVVDIHPQEHAQDKQGGVLASTPRRMDTPMPGGTIRVLRGRMHSKGAVVAVVVGRVGVLVCHHSHNALVGASRLLQRHGRKWR